MRDPNEIPSAVEAATRERVGAFLLIDDVVISSHQRRILELAGERRLPVISIYSEFAQAGGLIACGPSGPDTYWRAAYFIDRILKGARPADLPVEQSTRFELVVNLKTAKALGLTVPQSVLVRADQLIE